MRLIVGLALVLGIAGTALGIYALVDEDDEAFEEQTLVLTETETGGSENDVPPLSNGEEEVSGGDSFTFTSDLSGDATGTSVGQCVAATEEFETICSATLRLEDGAIELAGSPDFAAQEDGGFEVAIVGGTGAYEGAMGSMTVDEEEGGDSTNTLNLLLPDDGEDDNGEDDD